MNEILQKRIEEEAQKFATTTDDKIMSFAYLAAKQMAYWLVQNQWISVEEALPEEDEKVIAMSEFGDIERMKYHNKAFYHLKGSIIKDGEKITHWMSIPELKGGEE